MVHGFSGLHGSLDLSSLKISFWETGSSAYLLKDRKTKSKYAFGTSQVWELCGTQKCIGGIRLNYDIMNCEGWKA